MAKLQLDELDGFVDASGEPRSAGIAGRWGRICAHAW
jgi:hypothetical protein